MYTSSNIHSFMINKDNLFKFSGNVHQNQFFLFDKIHVL